ncbi:MAG: tetratricopeptide repeat protein, partial [Candidatus Omnitrophica bacterium]|nr:tetratricopeptide repeat protein [Candidatus Omnitrophota bacterium]
LLLRMNRLADAEVLMRRALSIDEISFPGGHPIVARDLTNLAGLLRDTGRPIEAEPLMYRALDLLLQFTQNAGQSHPIIRDSLCNYRLLLSELDFTETEVRNRINSLIEGYGMKMEDLDIQEERNY